MPKNYLPKFLRRFLTGRQYDKNKKRMRQALEALNFIEFSHQQMGWTRKERRQWWNDFIYSPRSRQVAVEKFLTQFQTRRPS